MEDLSVTTTVAIAGFIIGLVFGAIVIRTNFCTMGAISDMMSFGDWRRFRAWLLAAATAIVGAQAMQYAGMVDFTESIYLTSSFNWVGNIVGGLMFGFGMVLAGGCAGRNLARVGSGDIRSFFVLVIVGVVAYMTLRGLIAIGRVEVEALVVTDLANAGIESQGLGAIIAGLIGLEVATAHMIVLAVIVLALLAFAFKDKAFRSSPVHIISGLGVGLCVIAGWWATGVLGADDFDPTPLASLTFVAPTGNALQYLMTFSGSTINFGIATVGGTILGSFLAAIAFRRFRVTTFADVPDTLRNLVGAVLMGVGGVVALGCTIGQAITGFSTLSLGSMLAFAGIVIGGIIGIKYMERALGI
ncbi:MAG: YeeE/YedE family protein [Hyphomicrobiales bacterium]|nr:MAG: YeeE/YedE family protein [Hyphomicrobiales bacterium]